ncbi:hypothetical protein JQ543_21190 [Bradyrhizobium diazoefficiens]|nr:hypothetical protein [Bradyrhizobium diazoefficiens]MBR0850275.1 hypothetical protein [Bradyrhizobium diazoefficiens]
MTERSAKDALKLVQDKMVTISAASLADKVSAFVQRGEFTPPNEYEILLLNAFADPISKGEFDVALVDDFNRYLERARKDH